MNLPEWTGSLMRGFEWVLKASWQGAVLIVLVLLVQWVFGKQLNARWRFNLWGLVIIRLLLPFSPESAWSVFNVFKTAPVVAATVETIPLHASSPVSVKSTVSVAAVQPAAKTKAVYLAAAPATSAWKPMEIATFIWMTGVMIFGSYVIWITIRMQRQLRKATPIRNEEVLRLFEYCREEMKITKPVRLLETPVVKSPALCGVMNPSLLFPPGLIKDFSLSELRYVFLHELAHVKRRDVSLNWLLTLLQIIHWFNPVVWFGFARVRADRELACDALAIASSPEHSSHAYGLTILKLLQTLSRPSALPGMVGILEDKQQMKRRIRMIAAFKKSRRWSILAVILIAVLGVTALTDAVTASKKKDAATKAKASKQTATSPESKFALTPLPVPSDTIFVVAQLSGPPSETANFDMKAMPDDFKSDLNITEPMRFSTRPGSKGVMELIREFRYPTALEYTTFPEEKGLRIMPVLTPTAFQTKNIGSMLNLTAALEKDVISFHGTLTIRRPALSKIGEPPDPTRPSVTSNTFITRECDFAGVAPFGKPVVIDLANKEADSAPFNLTLTFEAPVIKKRVQGPPLTQLPKPIYRVFPLKAPLSAVRKAMETIARGTMRKLPSGDETWIPVTTLLGGLELENVTKLLDALGETSATEASSSFILKVSIEGVSAKAYDLKITGPGSQKDQPHETSISVSPWQGVIMLSYDPEVPGEYQVFLVLPQ